MNYLEYNNYYFIGIGGIGMSALAEYLISFNKVVSGYDREKSVNTERLINLGIKISHKNDLSNLNLQIDKAKTLVIYTPAINNKNIFFSYFKNIGFNIIKRSDLLAEVVNNKFCIAIAGTHGKTTTTSILSHILYNSKLKFTSFIGGIINKYDSNIILNGDDVFIVEADEYDKTFLKLHPNIITILNIDGDHYDIYKDYADLLKSFKEFSCNLKKDGVLFYNENLDFDGISFGLKSKSDLQIMNFVQYEDKSVFDLKANDKTYKKIEFKMIGIHNALNALVAFSIALKLKIDLNIIIKALKSFPGVKRRFSFELYYPKIYIDDYAHHPIEIESVYNSINSLYPEKKNLVIFQPHLYSRTKDFLNDFAKALEKFDKIALLDIYPAREEPINGVSSKSIFDKIKNSNKLLIKKSDLNELVCNNESELIISLGAGDIGNEVELIKKSLIEINEN